MYLSGNNTLGRYDDGFTHTAGAGIGSTTPASIYGGADGTKITIAGGKVRAYGGTGVIYRAAAGIGGGSDCDSGEIRIKAGLVVSLPSSTNNEFVYAESGNPGLPSIGHGSGGSNSTDSSGNSLVNINDSSLALPEDFP